MWRDPALRQVWARRGHYGGGRLRCARLDPVISRPLASASARDHRRLPGARRRPRRRDRELARRILFRRAAPSRHPLVALAGGGGVHRIEAVLDGVLPARQHGAGARAVRDTGGGGARSSSGLRSRCCTTACRSARRPIVSAIFLMLINFIGLGLGPLITGALSQLRVRERRRALAALRARGHAGRRAIWGGLHYWLAGRHLAAARP